LLARATRGAPRDLLEWLHRVLERLQRGAHALVLLRSGARGFEPLLQLPTDPVKHVAHR